jgi:hypothetical protein
MDLKKLMLDLSEVYDVNNSMIEVEVGHFLSWVKSSLND